MLTIDSLYDKITREEGVIMIFEHNGLIFNNISVSEAKIIGSKNKNIAVLVCPNVVDKYRVTGIGANAFKNSTSLKLVFLPKNVNHIGSEAFSGCVALKGVLQLCQSHAIEIESGAFFGCSNLSQFSANIASIGIGAFGNCKALEKIIISPHCKSIDSFAFFGCKKLHSIYFEGGTWAAPILEISVDIFLNCPVKYLYSDRQIKFKYNKLITKNNYPLPRSVQIMATALSNLNELVVFGYNILDWKT